MRHMPCVDNIRYDMIRNRKISQHDILNSEKGHNYSGYETGPGDSNLFPAVAQVILEYTVQVSPIPGQVKTFLNLDWKL